MECPNYFWPWFSPDEYRRRYALVRAGMADKKLECLLVYGISRGMGMEMGQANAVYLTSVAPWSQTYLVFPLEGEPTMFIVSSNQVKNIRENSVIKDVRPGGSFTTTGGLGQFGGPVVERLKELGMANKRIGIVGDSGWLHIDLPHHAHMAITTALPDAEFEVVTRWYETLRVVKSDEEIARMHESATMTDAVYDTMVKATKAGVRPCDLYNLMCRTAIDLGGRLTLGHVGRTPMSNPDMDYPHYWPLTTPIQMGDVVMTEVAAGVGGYYGKIWGTFFMGDPTPEYETLFKLGVTTSHKLHAAIKPGVKVSDLTAISLDDTIKAGYKPKTSITGWSNLNEPPDVRAAGDQLTDPDYVFQKHTCVSVTGWPSTADDTMGIWLGDVCLVTEKGAENFHKYPIRELHVVRP